MQKPDVANLIKQLEDHKFALDQASIVAETDGIGRITYVNDKFVQISGYERDELLGQDHRLLNSGYHPKSFFTDLWRTISTGRVWRGEIQNRAKDGRLYWVNTTIVPFLGEDGRPYKYMAIRTDITVKKQALAQLEIERSRTLHAEKMASLGELAAGLAHELGNPISSITAFLEVVAQAATSDQLHELDLTGTLPVVQKRADQMARIIRGMLTYARDGSRDPFEAVDLCKLIGEVLHYCDYTLSKRQVKSSFENPHSTVEVRGRESELMQVLVNLVNNACDAVADCEEKWLKITCRSVTNGESDHAEVRIMDSGTGLDPEVVGRMFKPFYTTKESGKGTGLGLSICESILLDHGGSIAIDTTAAHTCFVITIPRTEGGH